MIDTIFYFVDTYNEYRDKLNNGLVSPSTIVFVQEQKAIYKGVNGNGEPVRFGNMSVEDIKQAIESIVGDTLAIENDKLDVDINTLFSDPTVIEKINTAINTSLAHPTQDFTNILLDIINRCISSIDYPNLKGPKGDQGDQGIQGPKGDKGDDGYSITKMTTVPTAEKTTVTFQSRGINLGSFDVYNGAKGEKGDQGPLGERGPAGPQGPSGGGAGTEFDDTDIWNKINDLDQTISDEKNRLDGRIDGLNSYIENTISDLEEDVQYMKDNWPSGSGSSSNFGLQDVEDYLQIIGVWSENEVHNKTNATWSKILQSIDLIESRVSTLETNGIDTESLTSTINQKIANGEIQINLDTTYAKKTTVDDIEHVVEWMYSGLKASASQDKTFTELISAGKNGMLDAISNIRTQVDKLENGEYLATASVDAKVKDSISGMLSTADSTTAAGRFFSNVGDALSAGIITEANLANKGALVGLMASNDFDAAAILLKINEDESNVQIKADKIELNGETIASKLKALDSVQVGKDTGLHIITTASDNNGLIFYNQQGLDVGGFYIDENGYLQLRLLGPDGSYYNVDWSNMNKMLTTVEHIRRWEDTGDFTIVEDTNDPTGIDTWVLYNDLIGDIAQLELAKIKRIISSGSGTHAYKYFTTYPEEAEFNRFYHDGYISNSERATYSNATEGFYTFGNRNNDVLEYKRISYVYRWLNSTYDDDYITDSMLTENTQDIMGYQIVSDGLLGYGRICLDVQSDGETLVDPVMRVTIHKLHANGSRTLSLLINKSVYNNIQ